MKKKLTAILPIIIVIIVGLSMMYTNPVRLDKLAEGAQLDQCSSVTASYAIYTGQEDGSPAHTLTTLPGEADFDKLLALAEGRSFSRSFHSLFAGNKVEPPAPMAGDITLLLAYELPAGTLTIRTIGEGEEVLLSWGENTWQGAFPNMAQWLTEVMAVISASAQS